MCGNPKLREEILKKYAIIKNLTNSNGKLNSQERVYMPNQMTLGVELEIVGPASNYLYDISINGFSGDCDNTIQDEKYPGIEITSPILEGNNIDDALAVAEQLTMLGEYTNKSCGGHIHIGANYLEVRDDFQKVNEEATKFTWKSLLEMWKSNEKIMYKITNRAGEEHRGIEFAKPIAPKIEEMLAYDDTPMNAYDYKKMIKKVQAEKEPYESERIFSINFTNLNEGKNTLEFRLANGTIEPSELKANIELFIAFVDISKRIGIVRYKEKNKSKLTKNEEELLEKYKEICVEGNMSEEEQKDKLLEMMFDSDKSRIYNERYEKSTFNLEEEKQKLERESKATSNEYGAQLSDEEMQKLKEYKRNNGIKEEVEFDMDDLEELTAEIPEERVKTFINYWINQIRRWRHNRRVKESQKPNEDDIER